jgi:hypothetical protein
MRRFLFRAGQHRPVAERLGRVRAEISSSQVSPAPRNGMPERPFPERPSGLRGNPDERLPLVPRVDRTYSSGGPGIDLSWTR